MKSVCLTNFTKLPLFIVIIVLLICLNSCGEGSENKNLNTDRDDVASSSDDEIENSNATPPEIDSDNDGVVDDDDVCGNTPEDETDNVLSDGCSPSEITVDPEAEYSNKFYMSFNTVSGDAVFQMGSPEDEPGRSGKGFETRHSVRITNSYALQTTEVTQYQWHAVLNAAEAENISILDLNKLPSASWDCLNCPVENISWFEIKKFINILNELTPGDIVYRLPTEAEWEYACRAGSITAYSNGDDEFDLDIIGWFYDNSEDTAMPGSRNNIQPVAEKKSNSWGFYDMHGNVWELCSDWFVTYDSFINPDETTIDPIGPTSVPISFTLKAGRGGDASLPSYLSRSASRRGFKKGDDSIYTGFRLVRGIVELN